MGVPGPSSWLGCTSHHWWGRKARGEYEEGRQPRGWGKGKAAAACKAQRPQLTPTPLPRIGPAVKITGQTPPAPSCLRCLQVVVVLLLPEGVAEAVQVDLYRGDKENLRL